MTLISVDTALCPLPRIWAPIPFHGASPLRVIMPRFQVQRRKCFVKLMSLSALCGSPFFSRACHLADWWITIPMWRAGPAPVPSLLALAENDELHMLQRRRSPGLICIGWMEIKRFSIEAKLVNSGGVKTLNTRMPTRHHCLPYA